MPLIAGTGVIQKAYFGAVEVNSIMNSGVNLLNGGGVFPGIAESNLYMPLTHTLVPTRGASTPTFARDTVAYDFDSEGKLNLNIPRGCVRFTGARFVRNLIAKSEDVSNAAWSKNNVTATDATTIVCANATSSQYISNTAAFSTVSGTNYLFACRVTYVDIRYIQIRGNNSSFGATVYANIDLVTGSVTASTGLVRSLIAPVSAGVWDVYCVFAAIETSTANPSALFALVDSGTAARSTNFTGDGVKSVKITRLSVNHDVDGYPSNVFPEYVSVGVLASPYHGAGTVAGADGCKYFNTNKDGSAIPAATLLGYDPEPSRVNNCLWGRDATNAAWTKSNVTAAKTATGLDNVANSASRLTAAANDATLLQLLTAATGTRTTSAWIKRVSGSGTVSLTRNGGTGWTDITSSLVAGTWVPVAVTSDVGANPTVGLKMGTSGDVIDVDCFQDENGAWRTSPILTTTAAVTRNADVLSYASALTNNNFSALASVSFDDVSAISDRRAFQVYQDASNYWFLSMVNVTDTRYTSVIAAAFTTVIKTSAAITRGAVQKLIATASSTTGKRVTRNGLSIASDANTSNVNVSDLNIGGSGGLSGNICEVHIWTSALTDAQMQQVTT